MNLGTFRPTYAWYRLVQYGFEKLHPDAPWLTPNAIRFLEDWLRAGDCGFEWGSGRSTIWFAKRCRCITSVESDDQWYAKVREMLRAHDVSGRVDYRHVVCPLRATDEPPDHPYANQIDLCKVESLDWVLVDGKIRLTCMQRAMEKLKPGGLLILDNANRYVPNDGHGKFTTVREFRRHPKNEQWRRVLNALSDWRWVNTSNGIWDTRFWIKPPSPRPA